MKEIKNGIVFSNDISRILNGINAFDFRYQYIPNPETIKILRDNFERQVKEIFSGEVTIISEEEMMWINKWIGGECPHCFSR